MKKTLIIFGIWFVAIIAFMIYTDVDFRKDFHRQFKEYHIWLDSVRKSQKQFYDSLHNANINPAKDPTGSDSGQK
jgi:hypothetical protein